MKRTTTALVGTFGLAVLLFGIAPVASADVTNPADNPHKITVKGDDGQTYVDGQDTLPGYDDEECTYIPGAYFDFDANRVYYADGQWIPWTEWDRATGYKDWLAQKQAAGSGSGSTGGGSTTTSGGTKTGTKQGGSTSGDTKSGSTKTTTKTTTTKHSTKSGTDDAANPEASATPPPSPTPLANLASPSASPSALPSIDATTAQPSASAQAVAASGPDHDASAGSGAGIAILGGLAALGGIAYGVTWLVRRRPERGLA